MLERRWMWPALLLLAGCPAPAETDTDTAPPVETDVDTDTDAPEPVVFANLSIETSDTLYAVTVDGTTTLVAGSADGLWRFDGDVRTALNSDAGTDVDWYGLWGSGGSALAVGTSGAVLSFDTGSPTAFEDLGTALFQDVDGRGGRVTAVGWGGVYDWTGDAWVFANLPGTYRLTGVRIGDSVDWAVGEGGTILTRDSGAWSAVESPTTEDLHAISGSSDSDVWAVGEDGLVLHYDGSAWADVSSGTDLTLWGVWVASNGKAFVVGNNGTVLVGDASTGFAQLNTGIDANLYAVSGTSADDVWAVGNRGAVLRYSGAAP